MNTAVYKIKRVIFVVTLQWSIFTDAVQDITPLYSNINC